MNNEYIIVNKTTLDKRLEELRFLSKIGEETNPELVKAAEYRINEIELMSSQSIPLIPEIEKSFDEGFYLGVEETNDEHEMEDAKQDYISNLKLDI